jgi:hypothetical protein
MNDLTSKVEDNVGSSFDKKGTIDDSIFQNSL